MISDQIIKHIEDWAPPGAAWDKDNVGIQVGSGDRKIKNVFLTLELDEKSLREAIAKKCNFIFTHHPFIFKPFSKINISRDPKAKLLEQIIKNDITVFSAHTNLDFTKDGVSFELAKILGLINISFLENQKANQYKVAVFVPQKNIDEVADALFSAGGGVIGEYSKCSTRVKVEGTFEGSENSNPLLGEKEEFQKVEEIRLEVVVNEWKLSKVISELIKAHPYDEPAYDIYPLKGKNVNYGFGAIGNLKKSLTPNEFLSHICKSLKTKNIRYAKGTGKKIKKVAVCGGSGSELLNSTINSGADAFVTADLKYHTFQDGENRILFIDAGHYETEIHSLNVIKKKLENLIANTGENIKVYKYTGSTNPVKFFNNKGV